jgi:hypothetical protein
MHSISGFVMRLLPWMISTTPASNLLLVDHPLPSDCCRPIVVVSIASLSSHCVVIVVNIIVVVVIVVAAIDIHAFD